ncbi:MAG TPA: M55 family metallopeptidase [Actinomycetota bacterium]
MRVLISADMEGVTGATGWDDVDPAKPQFERFRRLLTGDVNAAIAGAFDGGADEVLVNEAHDGMRNVLIEDLDERVQLISGLHKPLVMMAGLDDCNLAFFVAYHARAGEPGVLAHTMTGEFMNVELNGEPASEARLNAALAGQVNVPVGMVSGDDVICAEVEKLFPGVQTAVVKYAIDDFSARCLPPAASGQRIRDAARLATVERDSLAPYRLDPPYTVRVTLREAAQAGAASAAPGISREGSTSVSFTSNDYREVYGAIEAIGTIAGRVR